MYIVLNKMFANNLKLKHDEKMWLNPIEYIIVKFKGTKRLASLLGKSRSCIYYSRYNGGSLSSKQQKEIIKLSKKQGIELSFKNLICGGNLPKKEVVKYIWKKL